METTRKNRISVGGLRKADPTTLTVLTQDVIRRPLGQIDRRTLLDLLALSEVPEQLPDTLPAETSAFREQMFREIADIPDGPPLAEFAMELKAIGASFAPVQLRERVIALTDDRRHGDAVTALRELIEHWAGEPAEVVALPKKETTTSKRRVVATPAAASAPSPNSRHQILEPITAPVKEKKAAATPAAQVDPRREEWVREDVVSRLVQYGAKGLKEPVVVAGARHRSPWKDMSEEEVIKYLNKMKRDGKIRTSAGRWMIGG